MRDARDLELSFIDASKLTVVVSPDEIDIITHYRPNAKVRSRMCTRCLHGHGCSSVSLTPAPNFTPCRHLLTADRGHQQHP